MSEQISRDAAARTIVVSGLPRGTTDASVEAYFQDRKKSGGEIVGPVTLRAFGAEAVICFKDRQVVQNLMQQTHYFGPARNVLTLTAWAPASASIPTAAAGSSRLASTFMTGTSGVSQSLSNDPGTSIIVSGIPKTTTKKHVELYFKKQAGGVQPEVDYELGSGVARLVFPDRSVAQSVINQQNAINSVPVTVKLDEPQPARSTEAAGVDPGTTIIVSGIPVTTTKKHIELYFKKQAGGVQPEIDYDQGSGVARLVFPFPSAAQSVINQQNAINSVPVTVKLDEPQPARSAGAADLAAPSVVKQQNAINSVPVDVRLDEPPPVASRGIADVGLPAIIVSGIHTSVTMQHLKLYFKKHSGGVQPDVEYQSGSGTAKLRFPDQQAINDVLSKPHEINKFPVTVRLDYPAPNATSNAVSADVKPSVVVSGIHASVSKKHLELYFKKEAGGVLPDVEYFPGSGEAKLTFLDQQAIDVILSKRHEINKHPVDVKLSVPATYAADSTVDAVELQGPAEAVHSQHVPPGVTNIEVQNVEPQHEELVHYYFMKQGAIADYKYLPEAKRLLLTYHNTIDASKILQKAIHEIVKDKVKVTVTALTSDFTADGGNKAKTDAATVIVTGIPAGTYTEHLQLYFESVALSGGGDIASLDFAIGSSCARVTFKSSKVADRVSAVTSHLINGAPLSVTLLQSPAFVYSGIVNEDSDFGEGAIVIEDIPETVIEDYLRLYFSNPELSGGGKIDQLHYNQRSGSAIIIFVDSAEATRVSSRSKHSLDGSIIKVELFQRKSDCRSSILYIDGLTEKNCHERLWWWLSAAANICPEEMIFKDDNSAAIAIFTAPVAFRVIMFSCYNNLDDAQLIVKRRTPTDTVLVEGLPQQATENDLVLYFEHPRYGGSNGCISNITISNSRTATVIVKSPELIPALVQKAGELSGHKLRLVPYYRDIGPVSAHNKFRSQDGALAVGNCTHPPLLVLQGFHRDSDERAVLQYFDTLREEDKRNDVGIFFEDCMVRAQLADVIVANTIANMQDLSYNGTPIKAEMRQQTWSSNMESDVLLVRVTESVLWDHLKFFLWSLCKVPVISYEKFTDEHGSPCTMVWFAGNLTFDDQGRLPWLPANFQGHPFDVELVTKPCTLLAANLPSSISERYLKLLFAASGAQLEYANPVAPGGWALRFASNQDAMRLLKQRVFYNGTLELKLKPCYFAPEKYENQL